MKKLAIVLSLLLVVCVIVIVIIIGKPVDNTMDEISNIKYSDGKIACAGFEEEYSTYWLSDSKENSVVIDNQYAYSGEQSLRLGLEEEYLCNIYQYINNLQPGYYYLEAWVLNDGNQEYCYMYGNGTAQGQCMTAVPKGVDRSTWRKVTVRGIKVEEDGILKVGILSKGANQFMFLDDIHLEYENNQEYQYESLYGGAISWLDWVEDMGGKYYYEDGTEGDALQIMAESGCNFVRLELYNNPGEYVNEWGDMFPKGYKDADAIYDLAVRAHNKGMKIQLSFMYSDYWGNEAIPADWLERIEGVNDNEKIVEILSECIYEYTKSFMERLADAGIYPEYVSLGNEMSGGILLPYGNSYASEESTKAFKAFINAGYKAVKEVSKDSKIVLHIACNGDDLFWESKVGTGMWFFELCEENDIEYDVIGTSYYPFWGQTDSEYAIKNSINTDDMVEWCNMMIDRFDKDILVMESGINWGTPGQLANNGSYEGIYEYTPEDQRNYMYELINALKSVKDGRCVGDLYWDPVLVRQEGVGWAVKADGSGARPNCVETTTFFDYNHIALPVLDAYYYNRVGTKQVVLYGWIASSEGDRAINKQITIKIGNSEYKINTDAYGTYYLKINENKGKITINGKDVFGLNAVYGATVFAVLEE